MSALTLVLFGFLGLGIFSALLILAACVASSRSSRIVARHSAKVGLEHSLDTFSADVRQKHSITNREAIVSAH